MSEIVQVYWPYILVAFVIGLAAAWYVTVASRRTSVISEKRDVLDDGAQRAQRNQTLIDTPPANAASPGPLSAAANTQETAHASAVADAEAGAEVVPTRTEPAPGDDDLTRIKGLGPKLSAMLNTMNVTSFAQIAAWDDAEIDRIDSKLGRFQGRIRRDDWVTQAKMLAAGDENAFSERFGQNR